MPRQRRSSPEEEVFDSIVDLKVECRGSKGYLLAAAERRGPVTQAVHLLLWGVEKAADDSVHCCVRPHCWTMKGLIDSHDARDAFGNDMAASEARPQ
mgnify:CR=1 FL=1